MNWDLKFLSFYFIAGDFDACIAHATLHYTTWPSELNVCGVSDENGLFETASVTRASSFGGVTSLIELNSSVRELRIGSLRGCATAFRLEVVRYATFFPGGGDSTHPWSAETDIHETSTFALRPDDVRKNLWLVSSHEMQGTLA